MMPYNPYDSQYGMPQDFSRTYAGRRPVGYPGAGNPGRQAPQPSYNAPQQAPRQLPPQAGMMTSGGVPGWNGYGGGPPAVSGWQAQVPQAQVQPTQMPQQVNPQIQQQLQRQQQMQQMEEQRRRQQILAQQQAQRQAQMQQQGMTPTGPGSTPGMVYTPQGPGTMAYAGAQYAQQQAQPSQQQGYGNHPGYMTDPTPTMAQPRTMTNPFGMNPPQGQPGAQPMTAVGGPSTSYASPYQPAGSAGGPMQSMMGRLSSTQPQTSYSQPFQAQPFQATNPWQSPVPRNYNQGNMYNQFQRRW